MSESARQIAREVIAASRGGAPLLVATVVASPAGADPAPGAKILLREDGSQLGGLGGGPFEDAVREECAAILRQRPRPTLQALYFRREGQRLSRVEAKGDDAYEIMVEIIEAPATLLIVGGGHIGLSLATLAAHVGFSVAVLDDRADYANAERFPMADRVLSGDVGEALRGLDIGPTTYVVMVSRGHKVDELALREVVQRDARYVGMIGSKRRVSTVLRHLVEEGLPIDVLERVYTPIGFDIGAETPEEIAVSILAEIIAVRRGGSGRSMREGRPPIS